MKIIEGIVTSNIPSQTSTGIKYAELPGVIVAAANNPGAANTTTDANGRFSLSVPDNETKLKFYTFGLKNGEPYNEFTIPDPVRYWNVRLNIGGAEFVEDRNKPNKTKLYIGIGIAALLLLLATRKKKSNRR